MAVIQEGREDLDRLHSVIFRDLRCVDCKARGRVKGWRKDKEKETGRLVSTSAQPESPRAMAPAAGSS